jgi:hypothetical protein
VIERERSVTDRFVAGAAAVYLALPLIGRLGVGRAYLPIRGYGAACTIAVVTAASASHAYLDGGLLADVALANLLPVGFLAAGVFSPHVSQFGCATVRGTHPVEPLRALVAFGALGGVLGAAGGFSGCERRGQLNTIAAYLNPSKSAISRLLSVDRGPIRSMPTLTTVTLPGEECALSEAGPAHPEALSRCFPIVEPAPDRVLPLLWTIAPISSTSTRRCRPIRRR